MKVVWFRAFSVVAALVCALLFYFGKQRHTVVSDELMREAEAAAAAMAGDVVAIAKQLREVRRAKEALKEAAQRMLDESNKLLKEAYPLERRELECEKLLLEAARKEEASR
jgi:hypothetical protein